jgi:hypothetical protein
MIELRRQRLASGDAEAHGGKIIACRHTLRVEELRVQRGHDIKDGRMLTGDNLKYLFWRGTARLEYRRSPSPEGIIQAVPQSVSEE